MEFNIIFIFFFSFKTLNKIPFHHSTKEEFYQVLHLIVKTLRRIVRTLFFCSKLSQRKQVQSKIDITSCRYIHKGYS